MKKRQRPSAPRVEQLEPRLVPSGLWERWTNGVQSGWVQAYHPAPNRHSEEFHFQQLDAGHIRIFGTQDGQPIAHDSWTFAVAIPAAQPALAPVIPKPLSADPVGYTASLFPLSAVTDTAVQSGPWSAPSTWSTGVPVDGSKLDIPAGLAVTFDANPSAAVQTLRIDGVLSFATNQNTKLLVDSVFVAAGGELDVGTPLAPIAAGSQASMVFTDRAAIDATWDPLLLSRGLLSQGTVKVSGQQVTSFLPLAGVHASDTVLNLASAPVNWKIGDEVEIPGTNTNANQDEARAILAISGTQVTVAAMTYSHLAPDPALNVHAADVTRNIMFNSENPADTAGRGQMAFLAPNVTIQYAAFCNLGRTNKLLPVTTPTLDSGGHIIPGSAANARDRDPVHFLDAGTGTAATVTGSVVDGSPGWGWVNQGSYVNFQDDIACGAVGASFVAEQGNEQGTFTHDLAMRETGDGTESDSRKQVDIFGNHSTTSTLGDFAHGGNGFWVEGPGVSLINNVSVGAAGEAFNVYTLPTQDPYTGQVPTFNGASVTDGVLAQDSGNVAYGSRDGLDLLYHGGRSGRSVVDSFTAWNVSRYGMQILYAGHLTVQNSWIRGYSASPGLLPYGVHLGIEAMDDLTFTNDKIEYCAIGLHTAPLGHMYVHGGYWNDLRGIDVRMPNTPNGLNLTVDGAITFGNLTGFTQYGVYMDPDVTLLTQQGATSYARFPDYFAASQVLLNFTGYVGQLYWNEQAAGYAPFVSGSAPTWTPPALLGLTNQQLGSQYGLAWAGYVAPSGSSQLAGLWGLLGSQAVYPVACKLVSPQFPPSDLGYTLIYLDQSGGRHTETGLALASGWNLLTRTIGGVVTTFFVYGP